jgi:hypothetical protein
MSHALAVLAAALGALLLLPAPTGAQGSLPLGAAEERAPGEGEDSQASEEAQAEAGEGAKAATDDAEDGVDESPDALRDPVVGKLLKRRVLIDRPRFSLETGGKLQVQYYEADPNDLENEDELFLRRFRPVFWGHIASNWTWKLEVELSADIAEGEIDFEQLDIRDLYLRYEGFKAHGTRLTIGNQKTPFSRDFLTPSKHQLLIERTFVGSTSGGVPDRTLGAHLRGETHQGKLAYWGNVGAGGHDPDVNRLKFDSLIGGGSSLNEGLLVAGRVDVHPRGAMTFTDGDPHTPRVKYTWSLAGYVWENDGNNNTFTEDGVSVDPLRADLDSATGLELSGGLRGRGISLDWQVNRIQGETVDEDFTGGLYVDGETRLDAAAVEGSYWFGRSPFELGAALARIEADGYTEPWDSASLVLNLHGWRWIRWFGGKVQMSHEWVFSRRGVPGEDFRQTRVQVQYVW